MPIESTQHLFNLPGPQGWEEMRLYMNEKFIPAPLTDGLGRRPSGDALVWDQDHFPPDKLPPSAKAPCVVCSRVLPAAWLYANIN